MMTYILESALKDWDLAEKRIFVRADLNIPLQNGTIINDFRLQQTQKSIDYIIQQGGTVILASHLGRPVQPDDEHSLAHLLPWFKERGYAIQFAESLDKAYAFTQSMHPGSILLLENLRFFPQEQSLDLCFAKSLARLADFYVDDAFGALHRYDTSITITPRFFNEKSRTVGFLVQRELSMLNTLLINPVRPFVLVLGGCKVHEKIALIENLLPLADEILLCPALSFSFMNAMGMFTGKSLIDPESELICRAILERAQKINIPILMPVDFLAADKTIHGPLTTIDAQSFTQESIGISIGPKTIDLYSHEISQAKTIFYNGLMGFQDRPETLHGTRAILQAMAFSKGYTVIGGGDTVGAAETFDFANKFSFISTGGGATMTYLSGQPLPGIEAIIQQGMY